MSSTKQKRLFIIDGYATLYRAHYALIRNPLTNSAGTPTSAIFGFANQVFQLIEEENQTIQQLHLITKGKNFKYNEIFEEYKANRSEMPDEIFKTMADMKKDHDLSAPYPFDIKLKIKSIIQI